jgi:hypothetical protein
MIRRPARSNPARRQVASGASIPAPVGGWDAVSALADMPTDRAVVLDNWFPRPGDVEVRRGHTAHAAGMGSNPVETLAVYNGTTSAASRMFAITGATIWDVSSAGLATTTGQTGLSNNRWQHVNFSTAAVTVLYLVNGVDEPRYYNGSSWTVPAGAITGILPAERTALINVNAHKNRLWFIIKDTTTAVYFPTSSLSGAAEKFELGGFLTKGGYLVAMGTWTRDGGSGSDDYAVFVSSRGQAVVYQGTNPASPQAWSLVGVFDVGAPIGYRCFTKVGGDLALINIDGVLPISKALVESQSGAAGAIAFTNRIQNAVNEATRQYADNFGWEFVVYPRGTMALLNVPIQESTTQHQYVMNTLTGAWCRFKGQNANCWAVFRDELYFGGNDGKVNVADTGSIDLGTPVDAIGQTAYSFYNSRGQVKRWTMIQPLVTTDSTFAVPSVGVSTDFKDNATLTTPAPANVPAARFDEAIWDQDVFPAESRAVADWLSISGIGQCASIHFRARTGSEDGVSFWGFDEWGEAVWSGDVSQDVVERVNGFNLVYERGAFF